MKLQPRSLTLPSQATPATPLPLSPLAATVPAATTQLDCVRVRISVTTFLWNRHGLATRLLRLAAASWRVPWIQNVPCCTAAIAAAAAAAADDDDDNRDNDNDPTTAAAAASFLTLTCTVGTMGARVHDCCPLLVCDGVVAKLGVHVVPEVFMVEVNAGVNDTHSDLCTAVSDVDVPALGGLDTLHGVFKGAVAPRGVVGLPVQRHNAVLLHLKA
eukprot:362949-Chlamydomonas_euryale.AAC.2